MNLRIVFIVVNLFVILRLSLGQQVGSPPAHGFLEIAHDPSASAAQKKTIEAVIRSVNARNAEDAYKKVMADDALVLYGGGSESITDITPLAGFKNLKTLVLYNNQISDITALSTLTNLQTLRLGLNRVSDISPLRNLKELQSLQIDDNQISDLRPLAGLVQLRTLWIMRNKVRDITPLVGLRAMYNLYLSGNPVMELTPLTRMFVSDLRLRDLGIEDVSVLRDLNKQRMAVIALDLSKNRIHDVAPLARLDHVTSLNLAENHIADISAFAHSKFSRLDLHGNQITDISAITSLSPHFVDVRNNPIKDYKPLVALLRANPKVEIRADVGFDKALSGSVPVRPDLAKSPIVGRWRSDPIEAGEWKGVTILVRFEENGLCHMTFCPPGASEKNRASNETSDPVLTLHGDYSIAGTVLMINMGDGVQKREMQISGDEMILREQDKELKFNKVE